MLFYLYVFMVQLHIVPHFHYFIYLFENDGNHQEKASLLVRDTTDECVKSQRKEGKPMGKNLNIRGFQKALGKDYSIMVIDLER